MFLSPAGSSEVVFSSPVDIPHDRVGQLEGGDLGVGLVVGNHHQPTLNGRQLTRL